MSFGHGYFMLLGNGRGYGTGNVPFETGIIDRFTPRYWRIDGPRSMSFCATTNAGNLEAMFVSRYANDLCGLLWDTADTKDHAYLAYTNDPDYRGCVWDFDIELSPTMALLDNPQRGLTLTVNGIDEDGYEALWYISLARYADAPHSRKAHIRIDWDTVKAGFSADEPVNAAQITSLMLSCITSDYDEQAGFVALDTPVTGWLRITNSATTGPRSKLRLRAPKVPAHSLGMCTSYDDHYDLSPERIVENTYALGYRGWINHYVGMSTYPERLWDEAQQRFVVTDIPGVDPVNAACRKWHEDFAAQCARRGFKLITSVSYELFSDIARLDWTQRDYHDNHGATGWTPPSYLLSHCNAQAQAWLRRVFLTFAGLAHQAGLEVVVQVGEPWWWWNGDTRRPCVYDYPTRLAFHEATGLYAPEFETIDSVTTGTPYDEFKHFLRDALGASVLAVRDAIKEVHPAAQVTTLFFLPSILTPAVGIMQTINYPAEHYRSPNLDFFMTEAYDWLITAQVYKAEDAITRPLQELGYTIDKLHYLAGFVPDASMADVLGFQAGGTYRQQIWQRILGNMWNNAAFEGLTQHVWSYPQVMADSLTILQSDYFTQFYVRDELWPAIRDDTPFLIGGEGSVQPGMPSGPGGGQLPLPKRPVNLRVWRNSWGDIWMAWDSSVPDPDAGYEVQVFELEQLLARWTAGTSDLEVVFPISVSVPIFGFAPEYLRWRARRIAGARSPVAAREVPLDNSRVRRSVLLGGDSNMAAAFINASGPTHDTVSATRFRDGYAQLAGLQTWEVVPLDIAFGSAVVDKVASTDYQTGGSGNNYYWDLEANAPGPNALALLPHLAAGLTPNGMIWCLRNDMSAFYSGAVVPTSSPARTLQAHKALFSWIREQVGDPLMPIYITPAISGYEGDKPISPGTLRQMQLVQAMLCLQLPYVHIATDIIATTKAHFVPEPAPNEHVFIHLTPARYQALADAFNAGIAANTDLAAEGGTWHGLALPTPPAVEAVILTLDGIRIDYKDCLQRAVTAEYIVRIYDTASADQAIVRNLGSTALFSALYSRADYTADYGYAPGYLGVAISQRIDGSESPLLYWNGNVQAAQQPDGATAQRLPNGDIELTWSGPGQKWQVENQSIMDGALLDSALVSERRWVFTLAAQHAAYGQATDYVSIRIATQDGDVVSLPRGFYLEVAQTAPGVQLPTGGAAVRDAEGNATLSWDALDAPQWFVEILSVMDNSVLRSATVVSPHVVFTADEQRAAYGYLSGYMLWRVTAQNPSTGASAGPVQFSVAL